MTFWTVVCSPYVHCSILLLLVVKENILWLVGNELLKGSKLASNYIRELFFFFFLLFVHKSKTSNSLYDGRKGAWASNWDQRSTCWMMWHQDWHPAPSHLGQRVENIRLVCAAANGKMVGSRNGWAGIFAPMQLVVLSSSLGVSKCVNSLLWFISNKKVCQVKCETQTNIDCAKCDCFFQV